MALSLNQARTLNHINGHHAIACLHLTGDICCSWTPRLVTEASDRQNVEKVQKYLASPMLADGTSKNRYQPE